MRNPAKVESKRVPVAQRVDGGLKLGGWLEANGRSQLWLSKETTIPQQLISAYVNRLARPAPMSVNAQRMERVTDGAVTVWDWMTAAECAEYRAEAKLSASTKGAA